MLKKRKQDLLFLSAPLIALTVLNLSAACTEIVVVTFIVSQPWSLTGAGAPDQQLLCFREMSV